MYSFYLQNKDKFRLIKDYNGTYQYLNTNVIYNAYYCYILKSKKAYYIGYLVNNKIQIYYNSIINIDNTWIVK